MTLGSLGSSGSTQGKTVMSKMWSTVPSTSSEGGLPPSSNQLILEEDDQSFSHHHQNQYMHDSLDSPSNASIPPPPPPPTLNSGSGSYIITGGRPTTSSLANFYAERPCAEGISGHRYTTTLAEHHPSNTVTSTGGGGVQNIGSVTSIDRYGYRTLGRNMCGGNSGGGVTSGTLTRQPALPTFGYGPAQSSFHTLPHMPHHVTSSAGGFSQLPSHHHQQGTTSQLTYEVAAMRAMGNNLNQVQQQQQQKLSPSADSLMMMDQMVQNAAAAASTNINLSGSGEHNGRSHLDEEDTSLSLRMAATTHLQGSAYGNGSSSGLAGLGSSGNGNMMLGELDEDHSEAMMLSGLNSSDIYKSNSNKRFITGSYLLSDQSDSLLIDE